MTTPISGLPDRNVSAAEQSRMELQAKLNGLGGLNGRHVDPETKAKKLREACEGFESIFIQKMWQEMRNAIPKTGILTGREERFWQDMYDQELSKSMTRAGGIGLADMMYEQLSRNLVSASRGAAASVYGAAFMPDAAPLVNDGSAEDMLGGTLKADAAAIYENEAPATGSMSGQQGQAEKTAPIPAQPAASRQLVAQAQPAQAAQTAAASVTPAAAPLTNVHYSPAANTAHDDNVRHKTADLNQSQGLAASRQAMRDAGDKLGRGAVRPARPSRRQERLEEERRQREMAEREEVARQIAINQNGMAPGSPEALKAAVEAAKLGAANAEAGQGAPINLRNIVAEAQARNAMPAPQAAEQGVQTAENAQPAVKRVRRTTNIPQSNGTRNNVKSAGQAIRTLNVDNVGVNSRQGQGLAAYRAQRDMGAQISAENAHGNVGQPAPLAASAAEVMADKAPAGASALPAPLRAAGQGVDAPDMDTRGVSFSIPPLTATNRS